MINLLYKNDNLGGFTPVIDETGKITGYKTTIGGADTVFPFKNIPKTLRFSFSWSGSSNDGVNITKTASIPTDSEILCFARDDMNFKYKIPSGDGDNVKGGCCTFSVSFNNTTGVVTISMYFNPYTSYITVTNVSSSGTLYYY